MYVLCCIRTRWNSVHVSYWTWEATSYPTYVFDDNQKGKWLFQEFLIIEIPLCFLWIRDRLSLLSCTHKTKPKYGAMLSLTWKGHQIRSMCLSRLDIILRPNVYKTIWFVIAICEACFFSKIGAVEWDKNLTSFPVKLSISSNNV